jgi:hypothetical protein
MRPGFDLGNARHARVKPLPDKFAPARFAPRYFHYGSRLKRPILRKWAIPPEGNLKGLSQYGGIMKHFTGTLAEQTVEAGLTGLLGYGKHGRAEKPASPRLCRGLVGYNEIRR